MGNSKTLSCVAVLLCSTPAWSQVTPSELADLSLQELLGMTVDDADYKDTPWSIGYSTRLLRLKGFRRGTQNVSDTETKGGASNDNLTFPILPNVIEQQVHSLRLGYQFNSKLNINIALPLIKQSTDHVSDKANFSEFTIDSSGIGDLGLGLQYQLPSNSQSQWSISAGLSIPTGSIDETGDTPAPGTVNHLPYTMQLGSGTYDLPLALNYASQYQQWSWGGQASARLRIGRNDRDYRLGNIYQASTWGRYRTSGWFHPGLKFSLQHTDSIHGGDAALLMNGNFPAPITNPNNFGGDKISLGLSLRICNNPASSQRFFDLDISQPIYQDLNGVQVQEDWQAGFSMGVKF